VSRGGAKLAVTTTAFSVAAIAQTTTPTPTVQFVGPCRNLSVRPQWRKSGRGRALKRCAQRSFGCTVKLFLCQHCQPLLFENTKCERCGILGWAALTNRSV